MQFKALMLDIDGTIIPYEYDALPSKKVKAAIQKTRKMGITVCLVTGRSYPSTIRILKHLEISEGYAVVDGGALVYDIQKPDPIHTQYLEEKEGFAKEFQGKGGIRAGVVTWGTVREGDKLHVLPSQVEASFNDSADSGDLS